MLTILQGQSGSGKSTVVGLIERWYDPTAGTIKLDGRQIDTLNLGWLRRNVRLVQQVSWASVLQDILRQRWTPADMLASRNPCCFEDQYLKTSHTGSWGPRWNTPLEMNGCLW